MNIRQYERAVETSQHVQDGIANLANDADWQATLAGLREQYPNGVMHQ